MLSGNERDAAPDALVARCAWCNSYEVGTQWLSQGRRVRFSAGRWILSDPWHLPAVPRRAAGSEPERLGRRRVGEISRAVRPSQCGALCAPIRSEDLGTVIGAPARPLVLALRPRLRKRDVGEVAEQEHDRHDVPPALWCSIRYTARATHAPASPRNPSQGRRISRTARFPVWAADSSLEDARRRHAAPGAIRCLLFCTWRPTSRGTAPTTGSRIAPLPRHPHVRGRRGIVVPRPACSC